MECDHELDPQEHIWMELSLVHTKSVACCLAVVNMKTAECFLPFTHLLKFRHFYLEHRAPKVSMEKLCVSFFCILDGVVFTGRVNGTHQPHVHVSSLGGKCHLFIYVFLI